MHFQWYPGHMTKAKRQMQEYMKLIDLVIELVDARIPLGSRNPDIDELGRNKARLILMNKADLADERQTKAWMAYFQEKGYFTVKLDARSKAGMKAISEEIMKALSVTAEGGSRTGRCGQWWWGSPMWGNPHLSIPMQGRPAQRQGISLGLPKGSSGLN